MKKNIFLLLPVLVFAQAPTITNIIPSKLFVKGQFLAVPDSVNFNGTAADTSDATDSTVVVTAELKGSNLPDTIAVYSADQYVQKIIKYQYKTGKLVLGIR